MVDAETMVLENWPILLPSALATCLWRLALCYCPLTSGIPLKRFWACLLLRGRVIDVQVVRHFQVATLEIYRFVFLYQVFVFICASGAVENLSMRLVQSSKLTFWRLWPRAIN